MPKPLPSVMTDDGDRVDLGKLTPEMLEALYAETDMTPRSGTYYRDGCGCAAGVAAVYVSGKPLKGFELVPMVVIPLGFTRNFDDGFNGNPISLMQKKSYLVGNKHAYELGRHMRALCDAGE